MAGKGRELGVSSDGGNRVRAEEVETRFVVDSTDGCVGSSDYSGLECSDGQSPLAEVSSRRRRPPTTAANGGGGGAESGEVQLVSGERTQTGDRGRRERMGGCGRCGKKCEGFLTDREQRKVWGIGILYVLGFPLLLLMTVVGGLKVIYIM